MEFASSLKGSRSFGCCSIPTRRRGAPGPNKPRSRALSARQARRMTTAGSATREPWEFPRFLNTVLFFNGPSAMLAKMLKTEDTSTQVVAAERSNSGEIVMITGATGGVGKRIAQKLAQDGKKVRVLVRDLPKAKELFSEFVAADIVQRRTLSPEMFDDLGVLFSCTAVKVAPKEGDTASREKYYQGIKFFDPEIVGDTPEKVEFQGMRNLLECAGPSLKISKKKSISDIIFGTSVAWGELDDVVMGGVSKSQSLKRMESGEGSGTVVRFQGETSVANNGGFASLRCRNFATPLNLKEYDGVKLRVSGDGQRYKLILRSDEGWDSVGHFQSFETNADGSVQDILLPFNNFLAAFRGKQLPDTVLDTSNIISIQIMISKFEKGKELNDSFKEGPFNLDIMDVSVYQEHRSGTPAIVHVSSAGVTRPFRPDEFDFDKEPPAVKLNDELGGILTYKLKGEELIRKSGIPYTIVRPCALTEEPGGMELVVDQGDVIKGKVSREDISELCITASRTVSARDTTFEIKSTVPFSQVWEIDPDNPPAQVDMGTLLSSLKPDAELPPVVDVDKLND